MSAGPVETFICECCQLEHRNTVRPPTTFDEYVPPTRCATCNEHQGKPEQRAEDHEKELHRRLKVAVDAAYDERRRAEDMKQRMKAAFASRDRASRLVERVLDLHESDGSGGCLCGLRKRPTLRVVSDGWILDRIADMHERDTG
jgi:hypothetical protein